MNKLEILEEYNFDAAMEVKLFEAEELNSEIKEFIPETWAEALCEKDLEEKLNKIIALWENVLPEELSITIEYLRDNLRDADLIRLGERFYMLYSIMSGDEEMLYYIGGNPMDSDLNAIKLPDCISVFYEKLHNGFYDYCSKGMGLVETQNISCMAEDEWGILEELEEPLQLDLSSSYSLFETGSGGYIVIDLSAERAAIWFTEDQPEYGVEFWDAVDEWITIGMEE